MMDILPALGFLRLLVDNTGFDGDDDSGEFVPFCHLTTKRRHDDGCKCALCQYGDGGSCEAHSVIQRMQEIDLQNGGYARDDEYVICCKRICIGTYVKEPLERQGIEAPNVTAETCKAHFSYIA